MSYYIFISDKGRDYSFSDCFELESPYYNFGNIAIKAKQVYSSKDILTYCKNLKPKEVKKIKALKPGKSIKLNYSTYKGFIHLKRLTDWEYKKFIQANKLKEECRNLKEQIYHKTKDLQDKLNVTEGLLEELELIIIDDILPV